MYTVRDTKLMQMCRDSKTVKPRSSGRYSSQVGHVKGQQCEWPSTSKSMRFIPGSLLPRPRPLPDEVDISISCWGISEILVRNTFSSASVIKTMSSPGCRGRHIPLTTCPITPLQSIVNDGSRDVNQYLIVNVAVSKHGVEVLNTFLGIDVETVL